MTTDKFTGMRFGRLLVEGPEFVDPARGPFLRCRCDCGRIKAVAAKGIKYLQSCGCLALEKQKDPSNKHTTHGDGRRAGRHYLYRLWKHIKERCDSESCSAYHNYGGRGIKMHESFYNYPFFKDWILSNIGERPVGLRYSIDRVDNDKGYEPGNLRWATKAEQVANRRCSVKYAHKGMNATLRDICDSFGYDYDLTRMRLAEGWPCGMALTVPRELRLRDAMIEMCNFHNIFYQRPKLPQP